MLIGNLSAADLTRPSLRLSDPKCPPLVDRAVTRPLEAVDELAKLCSSESLISRRGSLDPRAAAKLLDKARTQALGDSLPLDQLEKTKRQDMPSSIPAALRAPVGELLGAISDANACVRKALSPLSETDRRVLIDSLPQMAAGHESKYSFVRQPRADYTTIFGLLAKIDLPLIRAASVRLAQAVQDSIPALRGAARASGLQGVLKQTIGGVPIEIGGPGDDTHFSNNSMLCIDLGGRNRYTGRVGAGVGYAAVLIDFGESTYETPDLSLGAGLLGIGIAYLGGNDGVVQGRSLCMGSGLAGVGVFMKEGGENTFKSTSLSEGFGMFGVGLMLDTGRAKTYEAVSLAQGAARSQGVGWLLSDSARADFRASEQAQGFSRGHPDTPGGLCGGAGLLSVKADGASFDASSQCQGAGIERGLGVVFASATSGTHCLAHGQAQAYGDDQGAGYFLKAAASGSFVASDALAQCFAQRGGVAFLVSPGNDLFAMTTGSPAGSRSGGIAIQSAGRGGTFMRAPALEGDGGISLFADEGGSQFGESLAGGQAKVSGQFAVALASDSAAAPTDSTVTPAGVRGSSDKDFEAAFEAAAGGLKSNWFADGKPALDWAISKRLRAGSSGGLRAIGLLAKSLGTEAQSALFAAMASADDDVARAALAAANLAEFTGFDLQTMAAMKRPALQDEAAISAGRLKLVDAVPDLMLMAAGQDREAAISATRALASIGDPRSISTGQALLTSPVREIRLAAEELVVKSASSALDSAKTLLQRGEASPRRTGLELLGKLGTPEGFDLVAPFLSDPNPEVKIQAMLALDSKCPPQYRTALLDLRRDANPLVRAVASRIDPGR